MGAKMQLRSRSVEDERGLQKSQNASKNHDTRLCFFFHGRVSAVLHLKDIEQKTAPNLYNSKEEPPV